MSPTQPTLSVRNTRDATSRAARDVGIVICCVVALLFATFMIRQFLLPRLRRDRQARDQIPSAYRSQHIDPAEFMRYCALRAQRRTAEENAKGFVALEQLELVAPSVHYRSLVAASEKDAAALLHPSIVPPQQALLGHGRSGRDGGLPTLSVTPPSPPPPGLSACSICLGRLHGEERIRQTQCGHIFHAHCLEKWLTQCRGRCPLCQDDLALKSGKGRAG